MTEAAQKSAAWLEANRLLGALSASMGSPIEARLGSVADPDDWQERAAIMEYDGGLPREVAERFARELAAMVPASSPGALAAIDAQLWALDARRPSSASARARRS